MPYIPPDFICYQITVRGELIDRSALCRSVQPIVTTGIITVTLKQYQQIHNGMTHAEVIKLLGVDGSVFYNDQNAQGFLIQRLNWTNFDQSWLHLTFSNDIVVDKLQNGLN